MENQDQNVSQVLSAVVLISAVMFTASVYLAYNQNKEVALYEEVESSYNQTATAFMQLRELRSTPVMEEGTMTDLDVVPQ